MSGSQGGGRIQLHRTLSTVPFAYSHCALPSITPVQSSAPSVPAHPFPPSSLPPSFCRSFCRSLVSRLPCVFESIQSPPLAAAMFRANSASNIQVDPNAPWSGREGKGPNREADGREGEGRNGATPHLSSSLFLLLGRAGAMCCPLTLPPAAPLTPAATASARRTRSPSRMAHRARGAPWAALCLPMDPSAEMSTR